MRARVGELIDSTLAKALKEGLLKSTELPGVIVELSKRPEFGDYATNVAMLLAPKEKRPPREIAEDISGLLAKDPSIEKCEVAGPGFINIFLKNSYWSDLLIEILNEGADYGRSDIGKGLRVQVEFVSANPTGPLHIGHGRGAAVGDALVNILKFAGYEVTKEYYVNDVGKQVYNLGVSVELRAKELDGEKVELGEDHYKGDYIIDIARKYKESGSPKSAKDFAIDAMLEVIDTALKDFNVEFDIWFKESELDKDGRIMGAIDELRGKEKVYDKDGAVWLKTEELGDDKDRVLIKADGEKTYFASDIAYHRDKFERGFDRVVNIWGADHHGYEARVRAALKAFGYDDEKLSVIFIQMVSLLREGTPVAMGKRAGEFVTLKDVMSEVGTDACRFFFLMRKPDAQLDFDLELAKKSAPENPVYYVQYCHARICSIISHAKEQGIELPETPDPGIIGKLTDKDDLDIIKHLAAFSEVVEASAASMEPHRINYYVQQLAGLFHPYYNRHRVVTDDKEETLARLYLCTAIKGVVEAGLKLLGVSAPDTM